MQLKEKRTFVHSRVAAPLRPGDVLPTHLSDLKGVFRTKLSATVVADFIRISQKEGQWTAMVWPEKTGDDSHFAKMVASGLLVEREIDQGWAYELSLEAICMIVAGPATTKAPKSAHHQAHPVGLAMA